MAPVTLTKKEKDALTKKVEGQVADIVKTLSDFITRSGKTMYHVGRKAGLSDRTLWAILEKGRSPQIRAILRACHALEIKPSELLRKAGL